MSTPTHLDLDAPLTLGAQDEYAAAHDAARLKAVLTRVLATETTGRSNTAVGLYGPWGIGKTSVMNLAVAALNADTTQARDFRTTLTINAWELAASELSVGEALLAELLEGLGGTSKRDRVTTAVAKGIQDITKELPKGVSAASIPMGWLANRYKTLADVEKKLKEKVSGYRLVVFLDDVDRLDGKALEQLFVTLLVTTKDLPVVYVLAMDEGVVSSTLSTQLGIKDGLGYLEKVVVVPFPVSRPSARSISLNLQDKLEAVLTQSNLGSRELHPRAFWDKYRLGLAVHLSTPRDAARLVNRVLVTLDGSSQLVLHAGDFLVVEALALLDPEFHSALQRNAHLVLIKPSRGADGAGGSAPAKRARQAFGKYLDQEDPLAESRRALLALALPDFLRVLDGKEPRFRVSREPARLEDPFYFDMYFRYGSLLDDVKDARLKRAWTAFKAGTPLLEAFAELQRKSGQSREERLDVLGAKLDTILRGETLTASERADVVGRLEQEPEVTSYTDAALQEWLLGKRAFLAHGLLHYWPERDGHRDLLRATLARCTALEFTVPLVRQLQSQNSWGLDLGWTARPRFAELAGRALTASENVMGEKYLQAALDCATKGSTHPSLRRMVRAHVEEAPENRGELVVKLRDAGIHQRVEDFLD